MLTIIFRVLPIGSENNAEVLLYQSLNFHSWTRDDNFKLNDSLEVIFLFVRDGIERPLAGDMAKGTIPWNLGKSTSQYLHQSDRKGKINTLDFLDITHEGGGKRFICFQPIWVLAYDSRRPTPPYESCSRLAGN